MSLLLWVIAALVVLALAARILRPSPDPSADPGDIDRDELEEAEREVRDLGTFTTPEEAEEQMPDWGPGAGGTR